jgi:hypothetical protein
MRLGLGRWALGVLLGYGLVILASPALHDFQHGLSDTPDNCAACLATPVGAPAEQAFTFGGVELSALGAVENLPESSASVVLPVKTPGRAPPA